MCSRRNPCSPAMCRTLRTNVRTHRAHVQNRLSRKANQHLHHKSSRGVRVSSKPQRHPSRQKRRNARQFPTPRRLKNGHASAWRIYALGQKQSRRRAYQRQRRKGKAAALMSSGQRNPAQRSRLRGIDFIRNSRKSGLRMIYQNMNRPLSAKSQIYQKTVVRCDPKPHQQNRPMFVM